MKTDYVDIMQYHNPTVEECEAGDLVAVLQDMKAQGKVRWLGISTTLPHLPHLPVTVPHAVWNFELSLKG